MGMDLVLGNSVCHLQLEDLEQEAKSLQAHLSVAPQPSPPLWTLLASPACRGKAWRLIGSHSCF